MPVRLRLLVAGQCRQLDRIARRGGRWRSVPFPATVGVIEHPDAGVILFDTGYSHRFEAGTKPWPYRLYRWATPTTFEPLQTAAAQLAAMGIPPEQVTQIVISHFHADHVGGLRDFPNARFRYLRRALQPGWRTRSATANLRNGFLPGQLPEDIEERADHVDGCQRVPAPLGEELGDGFDLLGDGSLVGLDLSGHVSGQLGLFLPETQGPATVLLADACWNRLAYAEGQLPHPVTRLFMADAAGYTARIGAIGRVAAAKPGLLLVPSHCQTSVELASHALAG